MEYSERSGENQSLMSSLVVVFVALHKRRSARRGSSSPTVERQRPFLPPIHCCAHLETTCSQLTSIAESRNGILSPSFFSLVVFSVCEICCCFFALFFSRTQSHSLIGPFHSPLSRIAVSQRGPLTLLKRIRCIRDDEGDGGVASPRSKHSYTCRLSYIGKKFAATKKIVPPRSSAFPSPAPQCAKTTDSRKCNAHFAARGCGCACAKILSFSMHRCHRSFRSLCRRRHRRIRCTPSPPAVLRKFCERVSPALTSACIYDRAVCKKEERNSI